MVRWRAAAAVLAALVGILAACSDSQGGPSGDQDQGNGNLLSKDRRGGTLYVMTGGDRVTHLDPQRSYIGVEQNFAGSFLQRTLTSYQVAHGKPGTEIVPDLATDTGRALAGGRAWQFTLREGVTFEDGSPITCADVKYGVSRTFAQDVITDGPQHAVSLLNIPTDTEGRSIYTGPYRQTPEGADAFDRAVTCSPDGRTITFRLARAVPDFNGATTLLAFSPVPQRADTAEAYDVQPVSSGPYRIESYTDKKSLVLVRNEKWNASSDPVRLAYPDKVVMLFSLSPQVVDARIERSSGEDAYAVSTSRHRPQQPDQVLRRTHVWRTG